MRNTKKKIAILGCGWTGKALKEKLESQRYKVNCLSRDTGMNSLNGFYVTDVLVIAIPPSDEYLDVIEEVLSSVYLNEEIETQVIFLSSISFYDHKEIIVEAEKLVKIKEPNAVILRLGGLMGYDRIAGKYTVGKTLENGFTNYVHRDDVVGIIESIIEQKIRNKILNVVAPKQSTKKEIYKQNQEQYHFGETYFGEMITKCKFLTPKILCDILGYTFKKSDVKNFWR